jgi:transcriptional regulator, propionate catabolism operon regulatory protein
MYFIYEIIFQKFNGGRVPNSRYRFALVAHSPAVVDCVRRVAEAAQHDILYRVANFESIIPVASECLDAGYEIILCHGGTGRTIVKSIGHSVALIDRTDMDVINTLCHASQISRVVALATHIEEHHDVEVMEKLLGIDIHRIAYATWNELFLKVKLAVDRGVRVLVGGGISKRSMENLGGTGFVIEPNPHSIREALEHAVSMARQKRLEAARREDLVSIFKYMQEGVVCIDNTGALVFSNQRASRLLKLRPGHGPDALRPFYPSLLLDQVLADGAARHDAIVDIAGEQFVVTAIPLTVHSGAPGAVALFRDVPSLQSINRKISDELSAKGFVVRSGLADILGQSPAVAEVKRKIARFAATDATVLVSGETGTGKELVAHALHAESRRRDKAFVAVNCAALPESLIESELFGYEDGAFTGAKRGGKLGLFEMAGAGSIFLDEVGSISYEMQLRLLRVLEAKEIMRVGGSRIRPVDVRVVCASHEPLPNLVAAGAFRQDLYYRLATLKIHVPPLRERLQDIPELVGRLLAQQGKPPGVVSPAMYAALARHDWPGNIRELMALIESYLAVLDADAPDEAAFNDILAEAVCQAGRIAADAEDTLKGSLERARAQAIREAVERCGGDKKEAARRLGISYPTLWRILRRGNRAERATAQ